MRYLFVLLFSSTIFAAEPWLLDVGAYLQFPIPAGNSDLANQYTPIIGGGGDFHWWFSKNIGIGIKSSSDYLTDMDNNIDLIELTQLGELNYRFSFSEKSFATFGLEVGAVEHIYRHRRVWKSITYVAPAVGGYVALPVRVADHWVVGPHAESVIQFFKDGSGQWGVPEWYVAIGVTASFVVKYP